MKKNEEHVITREIRLQDADAVKRIKEILETEPASESECFGEDETMTYTADFGDGITMDIKICGAQYQEGGVNMPWTEAVLCRHGNQLVWSGPDEGFFGAWELEYDGVLYQTDVICDIG